MDLLEHRRLYHQKICADIIYLDSDGIPNIADKGNNVSRAIAVDLVKRLMPVQTLQSSIKGQSAGHRFEQANRDFLHNIFRSLDHLRPGKWVFDVSGDISRFYQYKHLADLAQILVNMPELKTAFGSDYLITPDITIARYPVSDTEINAHESIVSDLFPIARLTPIRASNHPSVVPILHASVSVKWTLRSDRAQNARTEALNLIRNRKGHTPQIVAVTAEPTPNRIASLALGTGDIDCVYHFALPELQESVRELGNDDTIALLENMISGDRLRDISDLPFDLIC